VVLAPDGSRAGLVFDEVAASPRRIFEDRVGLQSAVTPAVSYLVRLERQLKIFARYPAKRCWEEGEVVRHPAGPARHSREVRWHNSFW